MLIREAGVEDAAAIARVHIDCSRTTYRGIIADHYLQAFSYEVQQKFFADLLSEHEIFCYVVEARPGGIVGFAAGCRERTGHSVYEGELYALYVLPGYQRQGTGRMLVRQIAERFHHSGVSSMLVWVLAGNPAANFYQFLGARLIQSRIIEVGGETLTEISYGWEDIRLLLAEKMEE